MKKILFSITALAFSVFAFAQKKADDVAKFKMETIDLGKLKVDNPATAVFEVTNISTEPLIIEQANPTCGCTIGDYTKEPIMPGKSGTIKATYNAKALNTFEKHLTVKFANVEDVKSITIKGEVLSAEDYVKVKGGASTAVVEQKKSTTPVKTNAPRAKTVKAKSGPQVIAEKK